MSVLIKDMEMPQSCDDCRLNNGIICYAVLEYTEDGVVGRTDDRPDWCPLFPIPPHGRLIDKDALLEDIDSNHIVTPSDDGNLVEVYGAEKILAHIAYAPTVIEAEGGE